MTETLTVDDDRTADGTPIDELVRSGGSPYIKITLVDPESGGVEIMHHGLRDDVDLPLAFRELADLLENGE